MKNKIEDLRNHLFAELEDLRDPDKQFNAERSRAVVEVAQAIIDSAKAENSFLQIVGASKGTGFIRDGDDVQLSGHPQARLLKGA